MARLTRLRGEAQLADVGLRPRHLRALTILRTSGGMTQQALATGLQMDRTNLVGLLNELEREDLVARRRAPDDRRRHIVELTEAGLERLCRAEGVLAVAEDEVLGVLDAEERETLYRLLARATAGHGAQCVEDAARVDVDEVC